MKKKVLLSSIMTIAICLCLIVGSTFALFTDTAKVNIAVTAGDIDITASVDALELYSVKATDGGSIADEFGGSYEYAGPLTGFANGGSASFENGILTLDKITPGDKVSFQIMGANASDITVQYRYIIECISGEELMRGLVVYVNGSTTGYSAMRSYTSAWMTLTADKSNLDTIPVTVELPVNAGNEYQEKSVEIRMVVEAVQGNADVDGDTAVVTFLDGSNKLLGNVSEMVNVAEGQDVALDLDQNTINGSVYNYGTVEISNGKIEIDNVGLDNFGDATLNNVEMNSGSPSDYGFRGQAGSTTVLNNTNIISGGGAIGAVNGAQLTFNGGKVEVDSKSTSGRYLFYTEGAGTVITINDGSFDFNKTQNQKRAYIYAGAGTTVYVNGGTFGKASTRSGYTAGILGDGEVVITGGIFGFDPTNWVKAGYKAVKNGSQWYVVSEVVDSVATSAEELSSALENGEDNILVMNATFTENNLNGRYYKDRNIDFVNCTFRANMNYMYINNATFTNCVFDCGSDKSAVHYDELFGDLVFNNCTFISGKIQIGARVENEVILGTVTFNDCEFAETATTSIWAEKGIRVYSPATFNSCEFNNRVVLAGFNDLAIAFNGCTMEGGKPVYYVDNTDGIIRGGNIPAVTVNQ